MMPTQSWKNLDPESGVHWEEPKEWWQTIRDNWPAYDKNTSVHLADVRAEYPNKHMKKQKRIFQNRVSLLLPESLN